MPIIRENGFDVVVKDEINQHQELSKVLFLEGLPVLHERTLTIEDLRDLVDLLLENSTGDNEERKNNGFLRPPKIRSIMANW